MGAAVSVFAAALVIFSCMSEEMWHTPMTKPSKTRKLRKKIIQ